MFHLKGQQQRLHFNPLCVDIGNQEVLRVCARKMMFCEADMKFIVPTFNVQTVVTLSSLLIVFRAVQSTCITRGIIKCAYFFPPCPILFPVTLPGALLAPVSSTSSALTTRRSSANSSSSMQTSYRLPNPLPPLPVRKGVRGRRPKSQTIALLKAAAEAAAAAAVNGASQSPARTGSEAQLAPRPHKKRGPKPKNKVRHHPLFQGPVTLPFSI